MDGILTGTTTQDQSGPASNGNAGIHHTPLVLKPNHQMQFHVIPRYFGELGTFCRGHSQQILSSTDRLFPQYSTVTSHDIKYSSTLSFEQCFYETNVI